MVVTGQARHVQRRAAAAVLLGATMALAVAVAERWLPNPLAYGLGTLAALLIVGGLEVGQVARCLDLLLTLRHSGRLQTARRAAVQANAVGVRILEAVPLPARAATNRGVTVSRTASVLPPMVLAVR